MQSAGTLLEDHMHPAWRASCPEVQHGGHYSKRGAEVSGNEHLAGNCGIIGTNDNQIRTDARSLRLDVDTRGCDVEDCTDNIIQPSLAHNAD